MINLFNQKRYTQLGQLVLSITFFMGVLAAMPAFAQAAATLSLSPTSGTYGVGSTFDVKMVLDTGGVTTTGADADITYDPTVFEVQDSNASTDGTQILPGSLYGQVSFNSVDNGQGKISFSANKTGSSTGFSGSGTFATITFKALKTATNSAIAYVFTPNTSNDSNIINTSAADILSSVTNASFTIDTSAATNVTTPTTTATPTASTTTTTTTTTGTGSTSGSGTGAGGTGGTSGTGGSGTVASTGIDLNIYIALTIFSLIGAAYFLTRKPKAR